MSIKVFSVFCFLFFSFLFFSNESRLPFVASVLLILFLLFFFAHYSQKPICSTKNKPGHSKEKQDAKILTRVIFQLSLNSCGINGRFSFNLFIQVMFALFHPSTVDIAPPYMRDTIDNCVLLYAIFDNLTLNQYSEAKFNQEAMPKLQVF